MPNRPLLLLVDPEPASRAHTAAILATAGWQVHEAESGDAAVAAVMKHRYALVLMDIRMPGHDGFETAQIIRKGDGPGASVPILALTATPRGDATAQARAAGMDGHVAKPFTSGALLATTEPWRPSGAPFPAAPLVAVFGEAGIGRLLARFRTQLIDALSADEPPAERRTRAHKIAGISGTLGFAAVSRLWLAVSEGDDAAWEDARIAARRALRQIDETSRR